MENKKEFTEQELYEISTDFTVKQHRIATMTRLFVTNCFQIVFVLRYYINIAYTITE